LDDVPEALAVAADHASAVRHALDEYKRFVLGRKCAKETIELLIAGVAVMLRAHETDGAREARWIHHRHVDGHIEVGSARHTVGELELEIGQRLDECGIGLAGDVPIEDVLHLAHAKWATGVGAVGVDLLATALYLWCVLTCVCEGMQDEPLDARRFGH